MFYIESRYTVEVPVIWVIWKYIFVYKFMIHSNFLILNKKIFVPLVLLELKIKMSNNNIYKIILHNCPYS